MKVCKACRTEIDARATKCPRCQAFQSWYRNPQDLVWLVIIPITVPTLWELWNFGGADFLAYQDQFSVEKVSDSPVDDTSGVTTYRIRNGTKHKWQSLRYEHVGVDEKGQVMISHWGTEYGWTVQPFADALVGVEVDNKVGASSWTFRIADLRTSLL